MFFLNKNLVLFGLFLFLLIPFGLCFNHLSKQSVVLNEICSCNNSVIYDANGTHNDYIELYNPSNSDQDISGYQLTDSKKKLNKFIFPEKTILKAKEYVMVWAGTEPKNKKNQIDLYTNFSIRNGEKIYLSNSKGKILEKIKIPKDLECDSSYSKIPIFSNWAKRMPSPLRKNPVRKNKRKNILSDISVDFSHSSGFYDEPIMLKLTAPEGFDIFYTMDSTRPSKESLRYVKPIEIKDSSGDPNNYAAIRNISIKKVYPPSFPVDKATIVRAIAIRRQDGAESRVKNQSYFIGFQDKQGYKNIPIISIITDPENLFDYEKGIYVTGKLGDMNFSEKKEKSKYRLTNYWARGKEWERDAYIEYYMSQKKVAFDSKIRINGGYSRRNPHKGFKYTKGDRKYLLRNGGSADAYFSLVKEFMIRKLVGNTEKSNALQKIVQVFLNGEYWGIYIWSPAIDKQLIKEKYGLDDKDFFFYKDGFCEKKELPKFAVDSNNIDIENLSRFLAINAYVGNHDWSFRGWNSIIWYNKLDKKYRFVLHDIEPIEGQVVTIIPFVKKLSLDIQKRFLITIQDIANYNFNTDKVNKLLDEIVEKYVDGMVLNFRRYKNESYSRDDYISVITRIRTFYNNRLEQIFSQLKEEFHLSGELIEVCKLPSKIKGGKIFLNTLELDSDEKYTGKYYSDFDISLDAKPFQGYLFQGWLINDKLIRDKKIDIKLSCPQTVEALWVKEDVKPVENKI